MQKKGRNQRKEKKGMRKVVKVCIREKGKKDTEYQHVRRRSKPCGNTENDRQRKRHNRRDDERLLSGWGLETWHVSTPSAAQIISLARAG